MQNTRLPALARGLLLWSALWVAGRGSAQPLDSLRVTQSFTAASTSAILHGLEQAYSLRFYYRPADLPTEARTFQFQATPLHRVLDQLLAGTELRYFFYRDYAVAIAPAPMIEAVYSADYYRALSRNQTTGATENTERSIQVVGDISQLAPSGRASVSGQIRDAATREPIVGATLLWVEQNLGVATDEEGRFRASLPTGRHQLQVQYIGYESLAVPVQVYSDGELSLKMTSMATELAEVLVKAESADVNVSGVNVGVARLDLKSIERTPALFGEVDIVHALLNSPGVTTIGEGAAGINVRGGEVDQNLILQDDAPVINAAHALGFYSILNPDLVNSVNLYKGNMPAQYGGRLASVLDVEIRDGNFERYRMSGGVGLAAGRLSLEGPVIKKQSSLLLGGRVSYANWLLRLFRAVPAVRNSTAGFYDLNARYTHKLNENNTLTLAAFAAEDEFVYDQQFGFDYRTVSGQFIYRHIFNDQLFSRFSASLSRYNSLQTDLAGADAGELSSGFTYLQFKELLTFTPERELRIEAGLSSVYYRVQPGQLLPLGEQSLIQPKALATERALESALFAEAEWTVSPELTISGGLRLNVYQFFGPYTSLVYEAGKPIELESVVDSVSYRSGQVVKAYFNLEPRLSARYRLTPEASLKFGYSRTSQYINQIFNTDTPTPTSQYQLSTAYIPPFYAHNLSLGYYRNFANNTLETSAEVYGRYIDQLWDYRDFARLTVNEHLETEVLTGTGRAYGLELSVKSQRERLNGQVSYTLSRTERRVPGINRGNWYVSSFDKPHNFTLLLNYQPNKRNTITANFTYSTGRPTTAPFNGYRVANALIVPVYSNRNQQRVPDYHRLDVSYTLGQGYNRRKTLKTSWTLSIYNLYARRNAYSVYFIPAPDQSPRANRLSILGTLFPAVTLNFETI